MTIDRPLFHGGVTNEWAGDYHLHASWLIILWAALINCQSDTLIAMIL